MQCSGGDNGGKEDDSSRSIDLGSSFGTAVFAVYAVVHSAEKAMAPKKCKK